MKVPDTQRARIEKLADIFQHVRDISSKISRMEDPLPEQLQQSVPGYLQTLTGCVENLRLEKWPFVLAGETRAMWMSFLSAITEQYKGIGEDDIGQLNDVLSTTKLHLIKLTYSERIYFTVTTDDNPSSQPVLVENWEALAELLDPMSEIDSPAATHKIDIHLPLLTLKDGFELIVVNECWADDGTDDMVNLLSHSYGFLYVLDLDTLAENGKFSCMVQQLQMEPPVTKEAHPFMVICLTRNQILSRQEFLGIVHEHLSLEESTVDYLPIPVTSTQTRSDSSQHQIEKTKRSIQFMFDRSLETKLRFQFSWLNSFITRVLYCMRAFFSQAEKSHEERLKTYSLIQANLETLTCRAEQYLQNLKAEVDKKVEYSLDLLTEFLSNEGVVTTLSTWAEEAAPDDDLWSELDLTIRSRINLRIKRELLLWEEHSQYFAIVRPQLIEQYEQNFSGIQTEISNVECMISRSSSTVGLNDAAQSLSPNGDVDDDSLILLPTAFNWKLKQKIALGIAAPFLLPFALAAVILGLPIIGGIAAKEFIIEKVGESKLKDYKANKAEYMQRRTREEVRKFVSDGGLLNFIKRQLKPAYMCIHQLQNEIPRLIQADRAQIISLQKDERETTDIIRFYNPLIEVFEYTKQLLMVYRVMSMHRDKIDVPFEEIELPENSNTICDGFNGRFQTAFWSSSRVNGVGEREKKLISLKILPQKLEPPTIENYLLEEEARRFQAGPNIAKFLGVTKGCGFIYHIYEPLKCSFRHFLANTIQDPTQHLGREKFVFLSKKLAELLKGLDYLHDRSWVHFDISLDSVAVDLYNRIKLTNISCRRLFQVPRDITQQSLLRYSHLPPEVLSQPPASYTLASEMYSVGILMWEMWHDQTHAYWHEINDPGNGLDSIEKFAKYLESNRPSVVWYHQDDEPPSAHYDTWMAHSQQCWSETDRLTCRALLQLAEEAEGKSLMPISEGHFADTNHCP